jgi:hypothetical protein
MLQRHYRGTSTIKLTTPGPALAPAMLARQPSSHLLDLQTNITKFRQRAQIGLTQHLLAQLPALLPGLQQKLIGDILTHRFTQLIAGAA